MIWLMLTISAVTVGFAIGLLLRKRLPWLGWLLMVLFLVAGLGVAAGTAICWDVPDGSDGQEDYAVLLGYALENGQASKELVRRCRTALSWMEENPRSYLVVSGGDPAGQGVTEAAVMAAWLRNHGAKPEKILIEDQAADTRQNLQYSKVLAEEKGLETDTVLIITSEYHQTRAAFLAEKNGQQPVALSCRTPMPAHLFASVREVYAFVKAWFETMG